MSWYLTIRSDAAYSRFAETASLVDYLATIPELRRSGPFSFEAAINSPWVVVILAACDPAGSYAGGGPFLPRVNVVELVCSDSSDASWYEALAVRIAEFLGWSAFEDNAERHVWPASGVPSS